MNPLLLLAGIGVGAYFLLREKPDGKDLATTAEAAASECAALFDSYVVAMQRAMESAPPPGDNGALWSDPQPMMGVGADLPPPMPPELLEGMRAIFARHCVNFPASTRAYFRSFTESGAPIPEEIPAEHAAYIEPLGAEMGAFIQDFMMSAMTAFMQEMLPFDSNGAEAPPGWSDQNRGPVLMAHPEPAEWPGLAPENGGAQPGVDSVHLGNYVRG